MVNVGNDGEKLATIDADKLKVMEDHIRNTGMVVVKNDGQWLVKPRSSGKIPKC
jgi:hypothetical protein